MSIICLTCGESFLVTAADLAFLERVAPSFGSRRFPLPPPRRCPRCRWQQRLAFRNERSFFRRRCDLTGQAILSIYPPGTKFPVYNILDWISDKWDAADYGREFDFTRPFFDQFKELSDTVPHFNLSVDPNRDQNSEYTNCAAESKNCYLISQAEANEDCYYSRGINNCRSCCDCLRVDRCELCYEGINLSLCYNCHHCQDCENCSDCYFSSNLRGCKNCFGCHNLIQKEFHFFNQPLAPADWRAKTGSYRLTRAAAARIALESQVLRSRTPHRYARLIQCEESTGDHLANCRDARNCYDSRGLEHCAYVSEVQSGAKYCQDYSICGLDAELLYQCVGCGYSAYHLLFCSAAWSNVSELYYCDSCGPAVNNCLGCFGLRRKEYCILNKQYRPGQYLQLAARVIEHMIETGEWGEFFPAALSGDAFNDTIGQNYFPLSREQAKARGWNWRDADPTESADQLTAPPDLLASEAADEICDQIFKCTETNKPFKIIRPELAFLRRLGLALPHLHPELRHSRRESRRNPPLLWKRRCDSCAASIDSTYSPQTPFKIYCNSCYPRLI